jgi:hypothetical protein
VRQVRGVSEPTQLTLDGREVPHDAVVREHHTAPLTIGQRVILARIDDEGGIRPRDAGDLLTGFRTAYPSQVGEAALRRLIRRGLVRHYRRGWYVRRDFDANTGGERAPEEGAC